jgi:hypothetical protein
MIGTDSHAEPNSLAATEQQPCSDRTAALQRQHSSLAASAQQRQHIAAL